jgi:hypothetical protein
MPSSPRRSAPVAPNDKPAHGPSVVHHAWLAGRHSVTVAARMAAFWPFPVSGWVRILGFNDGRHPARRGWPQADEESVVTVRLHHRVSGAPGRPTVVVGGSLGSTLASWGLRSPRCRSTSTSSPTTIAARRLTAPAGPYSIEDLARERSSACSTNSRVDRSARDRAVGSVHGSPSRSPHAAAARRVDRLVHALLRRRTRTGNRGPNGRPRCAPAAPGRIADAAVGRWLTSGYRLAHPEVAGGVCGRVASSASTTRATPHVVRRIAE